MPRLFDEYGRDTGVIREKVKSLRLIMREMNYAESLFLEVLSFSSDELVPGKNAKTQQSLHIQQLKPNNISTMFLQ